MERKTKIVATIGPASNSEAVLHKMIIAGMNVARLNMSHANREIDLRVASTLKKLRSKLNVPLAIMIDTKGPEIRIGKFANGFVMLKDGQKFTLTTKQVECNEQIVSIDYAAFCKDIKKGNRVMLCDGLIELLAEEVTKTEVHCKVISGGKLGSRKNLLVPGMTFSMPFLSEQDKRDLKFACEIEAEYIAASFVNCKQDVLDMRKFLKANGGEDIDIISKIESVKALENIDEIMEVSDGIMVARGDLGVELNIEKLPAIQKQLIKKAKAKCKFAITATEMLESMTEKLRPTRAEATDVANAVYDETSAVMLSGETAAGINPPLVIHTMASICVAAEQTAFLKRNFDNLQFKVQGISDAICHSVVNTAFELGCAAICAYTTKGTTAWRISRLRPPVPVLAITPSERAYNKLAFAWGVKPVQYKFIANTDKMFAAARDIAASLKLGKKGDTLVVSAGVPVGEVGSTNLIKIELL